jgi:hypothetical protein
MTSRIALWFSFLAIAAAVVGLVLLGSKLTRLTQRVAALENRPPPAPAVPPPPAEPKEETPEDRESRHELERGKVRQIVGKENEALLDLLVKKLALDPATEPKLREAFAEEFTYYVDAIVRSFDALRASGSGSQENELTSPKFRKGLEDRILATDEKVRELLNSSQAAVYDQWRRDIRKERYELD